MARVLAAAAAGGNSQTTSDGGGNAGATGATTGDASIGDADINPPSGPLGVTRMRTDTESIRLGIDVKSPRLDWVLTSDQRGQKQTAYQVLVATSEANLAAGKGDLWDSGKVVSDQSIQVVYQGAALASRQRAFWKVKIWDKDDVPSSSTAAWWEMGLLAPSDWSASWIAGKAGLHRSRRLLDLVPGR